MMPKRTDIRLKLKAVCEAIQGVKSVLLGRQRAIPRGKLSAICIYTENEEKALAHAGKPRVFDRGMDVMFEIHVQKNTTVEVEAELDLLCERLEAALLADETLGGLTREIQPVLDEYDLEEDARNPGGVAECRYTLIYSG